MSDQQAISDEIVDFFRTLQMQHTQIKKINFKHAEAHQQMLNHSCTCISNETNVKQRLEDISNWKKKTEQNTHGRMATIENEKYIIRKSSVWSFYNFFVDFQFAKK